MIMQCDFCGKAGRKYASIILCDDCVVFETKAEGWDVQSFGQGWFYTYLRKVPVMFRADKDGNLTLIGMN